MLFTCKLNKIIIGVILVGVICSIADITSSAMYPQLNYEIGNNTAPNFRRVELYFSASADTKYLEVFLSQGGSADISQSVPISSNFGNRAPGYPIDTSGYVTNNHGFGKGIVHYGAAPNSAVEWTHHDMIK